MTKENILKKLDFIQKVLEDNIFASSQDKQKAYNYIDNLRGITHPTFAPPSSALVFGYVTLDLITYWNTKLHKYESKGYIYATPESTANVPLFLLPSKLSTVSAEHYDKLKQAFYVNMLKAYPEKKTAQKY